MKHEFKFVYNPNEPKSAVVLLKKHTRGDVDRICRDYRRHGAKNVHIYCEVGIDPEMIDYARQTARQVMQTEQIVVAYEAVVSNKSGREKVKD